MVKDFFEVCNILFLNFGWNLKLMWVFIEKKKEGRWRRKEGGGEKGNILSRG